MSKTQVTSDAELARLLGVDRALVSRDKRRGMPTHTLEAAMAWRQSNLRPRIRVPTRNELQQQKRQAGEAAIRKVGQLMQLGHSALEAGHFYLLEDELRAAMRAVPPAARVRVGVAASVMDHLCAPVIEALGDGPAVDAETPPDARRDQYPTIGEAAGSSFMQRFWYAVAAGEEIALAD